MTKLSMLNKVKAKLNIEEQQLSRAKDTIKLLESKVAVAKADGKLTFKKFGCIFFYILILIKTFYVARKLNFCYEVKIIHKIPLLIFFYNLVVAPMQCNEQGGKLLIHYGQYNCNLDELLIV